MVMNLAAFGAGILCGAVLMLIVVIAIGRAEIKPTIGNK